MGYQVYEDRPARDHGVERWAGYGVPAICDFPSCEEKIDRGMGYRCELVTNYAEDREDESSPNYDPEYDGEEVEGCNMHFCSKHEDHETHKDSTPKPDTAEWVNHMLTDESWQEWRDQNPEKTPAMQKLVEGIPSAT